MATTAMISSAKQSKYYKKWIMSSKRDIYDIGIHFHSRCCVEERFAFGLFQFGVFCYEMKKYQLSYKLINKAYKMCSELPIIKKNWKSLNIELQNMMKELCCDYCRVRKIKLSGCEGCCDTYYCSKKCQKRGWRQGHRNHCSKRWLIPFMIMKNKQKYADKIIHLKLKKK
eukprot:109091_1